MTYKYTSVFWELVVKTKQKKEFCCVWLASLHITVILMGLVMFVIAVYCFIYFIYLTARFDLLQNHRICWAWPNKTKRKKKPSYANRTVGMNGIWRKWWINWIIHDVGDPIYPASIFRTHLRNTERGLYSIDDVTSMSRQSTTRALHVMDWSLQMHGPMYT